MNVDANRLAMHLEKRRRTVSQRNDGTPTPRFTRTVTCTG